MPSLSHEIFIDMVREQPSFVPELLRESIGETLPWDRYAHPYPESGELTQSEPVQYRADQVLLFRDPRKSDPRNPNAGNVGALILEVQRARDNKKWFRWPSYLVTLREQKECPTCLIVICTDPAVAKWAAQPIEIGHPGFRLTAHVIGPENAPYIRDVAQAAAAPELAMASAVLHSEEVDQRRSLFHAVMGGFRAVAEQNDEESTDRYQRNIDKLHASISKEAAATLEEVMTAHQYEYRSPVFRRLKNEGRAEGRVEGQVRSILRVLEGRNIDIPDDIRERITSCTDAETLDLWLLRAGIVANAKELFDQRCR